MQILKNFSRSTNFLFFVLLYGLTFIFTGELFANQKVKNSDKGTTYDNLREAIKDADKDNLLILIGDGPFEGPFVIQKSLTIQGQFITPNPQVLTVKGEKRVLEVSGTGVEVHLLSLNIKGGNALDSDGGGILNTRSKLRLTNVNILKNEARNGAGLANTAGEVLIEGLGQKVFIENNVAAENGGGILNRGGILTLINVHVKENQAHHGAGIYLIERGQQISTAIIENSNINHNGKLQSGGKRFTRFGGGIFNDSGCQLTLNNTKVNHNQANKGGGLFNEGNVTFLNQNEFRENKAEAKGGAIFSTVSFSLGNTIIQGNEPADSQVFFVP